MLIVAYSRYVIAVFATVLFRNIVSKSAFFFLGRKVRHRYRFSRNIAWGNPSSVRYLKPRDLVQPYFGTVLITRDLVQPYFGTVLITRDLVQP